MGRSWQHSKSRGREQSVFCGYCGRRVPKYKTVAIFKGLRINDPVIKSEMGLRQGLSLMQSKIYVCPGCARARGVQKKRY